MLVRLAVDKDVPWICDKAIEALKVINQKGSKDDLLDEIYWIIDRPDTSEMVMLVAEENGKLTGVFAGIITMLPFKSDRVAKELLFYSEGPQTFTKLVETYKRWAKSVGATDIFISCPANKTHEKWSKLYKRFGFNPYEHSYRLGE